MQYTCAYFNRPTDTLRMRRPEMDLVCRKLRLQRASWWSSGLRLGRLALHMVRNYGVRVKSFNISQEQIAFARERAHGWHRQRSIEYVATTTATSQHVKSC